MTPEIGNRKPCLFPRQRVVWRGGGLAALFPGPPGILGRASEINGTVHLGHMRG